VLYKVDSRKRTFAEIWRIHRRNLGGFLIAAVCKVLGIQQSYSFGIRRPESLRLHEPSDVPRSVRDLLAPTVRACEELDLAFRFYATTDAVVGSAVKVYMAALLHTEGLIWANAMATLFHRTQQVRLAGFNCMSRLPDGRFLATSDHVWKLTPHPGDLAEFLSGAAPDAVLARHYQRTEAPGVSPLPVREDELAGILLAREQRHVDYAVERGVYVPMTGEEIERFDLFERQPPDLRRFGRPDDRKPSSPEGIREAEQRGGASEHIVKRGQVAPPSDNGG
jgi:hypothetical protein